MNNVIIDFINIFVAFFLSSSLCLMIISKFCQQFINDEISESFFFFFLSLSVKTLLLTVMFIIALTCLGILATSISYKAIIICCLLAVVIWSILIIFVDRLRNIVGDLLGKPRCYNCGNSHFLRRDFEIPLSGQTLIVCSDCGKDHKNLNPTGIYLRLRPVGMNSSAAHDIELGVEKFKKNL